MTQLNNIFSFLFSCYNSIYTAFVPEFGQHFNILADFVAVCIALALQRYHRRISRHKKNTIFAGNSLITSVSQCFIALFHFQSSVRFFPFSPWLTLSISIVKLMFRVQYSFVIINKSADLMKREIIQVSWLKKAEKRGYPGFASPCLPVATPSSVDGMVRHRDA